MMDKLSNLLDENRVGTLATVVNQKPNSRYMTFFKKMVTLPCTRQQA